MKRILIALVTFVLGAAGLPADNYGMSSFPVMMMESYGARILSLADTGVALTGDLGALTANPAGTAGIERMAFSTMKLDWMFDTSFYNFAAVYPLGEKGKSGVLGFTAVLFDNGGFDAVVDETATGGSAGSDFLFGFSYANNIFNFFNRKTAEKIHLNWGVAVKFARSVLAGYGASALAFDAGLNYSLSVPALGMKDKADTLSFGFSVKNLSLVLAGFTDSGETTIPWYLNCGFAYQFVRTVRHTVSLMTAISKPSDNDLLLSSGLEYGYRNTIYLRCGYRFVGREHESLSFGFGLNFEVSDRLAFRLDYANIDLNEFGKSDTFSLSVVF